MNTVVPKGRDGGGGGMHDKVWPRREMVGANIWRGNGRGWEEGLPWKVGVRARSTVSVGLNSECSDRKRKTFVLQRWECSLAEARIREPRNKPIRAGLGQE